MANPMANEKLDSCGQLEGSSMALHILMLFVGIPRVDPTTSASSQLTAA